MTPYYYEDGITIYHGDCREILPELTGDVVLTDPPYGNLTPYDGYEDTPAALVALIGDVFPLMQSAATSVVAVTPGVGNLYKWPEPKWVLCWYEAMGAGSGPWGFCTWQPILVYGSDPYLTNSRGRRPDGFTAKRGTFRPLEDFVPENRHPTPKPIAVGRWLVERLTVEPSVIVDPFMGGGSFVRAARDLGHQAIGIEISERYCEIAVQRLAQGVLAL